MIFLIVILFSLKKSTLLKKNEKFFKQQQNFKTFLGDFIMKNRVALKHKNE